METAAILNYKLTICRVIEATFARGSHVGIQRVWTATSFHNSVLDATPRTALVEGKIYD